MMLSIITFGVKIKHYYLINLIFWRFFALLRPKPVVYDGKYPMQRPKWRQK